MLSSHKKHTFDSLRNVIGYLKSQILLSIYNKIFLNYKIINEKYNNYNV